MNVLVFAVNSQIARTVTCYYAMPNLSGHRWVNCHLRYSLISNMPSDLMSIDGSKIIFVLGVAGAMITAAVALFFALD